MRAAKRVRFQGKTNELDTAPLSESDLRGNATFHARVTQVVRNAVDEVLKENCKLLGTQLLQLHGPSRLLEQIENGRANDAVALINDGHAN